MIRIAVLLLIPGTLLGTPFDLQTDTDSLVPGVPNTAVAARGTAAEFLAVFTDQDPQNPGTYRIRACVVDESGTITTPPTTLHTKQAFVFESSVTGVRCSYSEPSLDTWLVVWSQRDVTMSMDTVNIWGCLLSASTFAVQSVFEISDQTVPFAEAKPDLDYEGAGNWVVVWEAENEHLGELFYRTRMRRVDLSGPVGTSEDMYVSTNPSFGGLNPGPLDWRTNPSVECIEGVGSFVAYSRALDATSPGVVRANFVPIGSEPTMDPHVVLSDTSHDVTRTQLSSDEAGEYVLVYQTRDGVAPQDSTGSVYARRLAAPGNPVGAGPEEIGTGPEITMPQIDYSISGSEYLVSWSEWDGSGYDIGVACMQPDLTVTFTDSLDDQGPSDLYPAISVHPGTGAALVVWLGGTDIRAALIGGGSGGGAGSGGGGNREGEEGTCSAASTGRPIVLILILLPLYMALRRRSA